MEKLHRFTDAPSWNCTLAMNRFSFSIDALHFRIFLDLFRAFSVGSMFDWWYPSIHFHQRYWPGSLIGFDHLSYVFVISCHFWKVWAEMYVYLGSRVSYTRRSFPVDKVRHLSRYNFVGSHGNFLHAATNINIFQMQRWYLLEKPVAMSSQGSNQMQFHKRYAYYNDLQSPTFTSNFSLCKNNDLNQFAPIVLSQL